MSEEDVNFEKSFNNVFSPFKDNLNYHGEENDSTENSEGERKINLFIVKKKRGKESSNYNGKYHSKYDIDNIRTKIQVHFLNFIVKFFNEIIHDNLGIKEYFLKFGYSYKQKVKKEYVEFIKKLTIGEIFENFQISKKYKINFDSEVQKEKLVLLRKNSSLNKLLNMKYLNLFNIYYNGNQPLKFFQIDNEKITLLKEAKSFSDLIEKNTELKNEIHRTVIMDYLERKDICDEY